MLNKFTNEEYELGKMLWGAYYINIDNLNPEDKTLSFNDIKDNIKITWIRTAIDFRARLFGLYGIRFF